MVLGNINIHAQNPDFLFMVEYAIKAPSGHNTQPWLFRINENSIEIHPNFDRALPVVDFDNRELFISLGCALENLCITALEKGYDYDVELTKTGIITVYLSSPDTSGYNSLFQQIPLRQTNRSIYNGKQIPEENIAELREVINDENINIRFYKHGTPEFDAIRNYIEQGNRIQMQDKAFKKELKEWMRFNRKHSEKTNDGLSYLVFGAPNLPRFTTQNDNIPEWIDLGRNLQRFLLKSTELNIIHSYFNQPNEVRELSVKMAESLGLAGEYPTILLRMGYGETMPYSKRINVNKVLINN